MRVLSIDIDYIMNKSIDLYDNIGWDDIPSIRWKNYYDHIKNEKEYVDLVIDEKNLFYCFNIFLKAIQNTHNITFSFNHDSILDELVKYDSIDLINIDHHDDIIYPHGFDSDDPYSSIKVMQSLYENYNSISHSNVLHEGNWVSFLNINKKINSYTFIGNEDSIDFDKEKLKFVKEHIPNFDFYTKDQYKFDDYNFDYVFVCLSPQYIPPCHWHYFTLFLNACETITGKSFDFDEMSIRKFSTNYQYADVIGRINYN